MKNIFNKELTIQMKIPHRTTLFLFTVISLLFSSCSAGITSGNGSDGTIKVLAVESFLADIAQNVAGKRLKVDTLIPLVERGGYIPFCDHRCPPNVTPKDYLYYLDRKEQLFGMR